MSHVNSAVLMELHICNSLNELCVSHLCWDLALTTFNKQIQKTQNVHLLSVVGCLTVVH